LLFFVSVLFIQENHIVHYQEMEEVIVDDTKMNWDRENGSIDITEQDLMKYIKKPLESLRCEHTNLSSNEGQIAEVTKGLQETLEQISAVSLESESRNILKILIETRYEIQSPGSCINHTNDLNLLQKPGNGRSHAVVC
jgi:hypothetical protein